MKTLYENPQSLNTTNSATMRSLGLLDHLIRAAKPATQSVKTSNRRTKIKIEIEIRSRFPPGANSVNGIDSNDTNG